MTISDLKAQLQAELPELLKQDSGFRQWLEQLIRQTAMTPESFDARFERMLQEFAANRAERRREWEEWSAKFNAHAQEQQHKWDEQNRKWDEQNRKNSELLEKIKISRSRQEQGIGALGARWGIASEHSFRAALKGVLEKSFDVEVLNVNEFDDEGMVFGAPDRSKSTSSSRTAN